MTNNADEWTVVSKKNKNKQNAHTHACNQRIVKECRLGICLYGRNLYSNDIKDNSTQPVSIIGNAILNEIMGGIGCVCGTHPVKKFTITTSSKYIIDVKKIKNNIIELDQWCLHYDRVMGLTPISVRKVIIVLKE